MIQCINAKPYGSGRSLQQDQTEPAFGRSLFPIWAFGASGTTTGFLAFLPAPGVRIVSYLCRRWSEVFNPAICPSLVPCWESIELPAMMRFPFFLVYTFHFYIYRPTLCSYSFPIHYFH